MNASFYDIYSSYEENYKKGPPITYQSIKPLKRKIYNKYKFLGFSVNSLFGIPAGPLLNNKFIKEAFKWGFDVSTYKSVRADIFPCHPFPNVLYVNATGDLHPDKTQRLIAKNTTNKSIKDFSITNSFGVPSKSPFLWKKDVKKAMLYTKKGQLMILSFMGTVKPNQTQREFINDFTLAAKNSLQTGAKVLEANLSCPNIGNEGLVCYNLDVTEKVCKSIRNTIGNTPLILKVGYYKNDNDIENIAEITGRYADAIGAINTLQAEVVDQKGNQALPGKNRLKSGICGAAIKWAGLEMTKKLNKIRKRKAYKYEIVGIGGVMTPQDYFDYREAGADLVQSATGAMWNPYLAYEIWKEENKRNEI